MSKYFIEDETLHAIGDAIRLKRDTVDEINPEDMPLAISLIDGGGGGQWEFLAEKSESLTLAQTTYGTITPSTTAQTISANQNNYLTHKLADVNLYNYQYLCVHEAWTDYVYTQTPTKPYILTNGGTILCFIGTKPNGATFATFNVHNAVNYKSGVYVNSSGQICGLQQNSDYGIYLSAPQFNVPTANTPSVTSGAWAVRANASYFDVSAFNLLDANSTTLRRSFKMYRIPLTEFPFNIVKQTYDNFLQYKI